MKNLLIALIFISMVFPYQRGYCGCFDKGIKNYSLKIRSCINMTQQNHQKKDAETACRLAEYSMRKKIYNDAYIEFTEAINLNPLPKYYCKRGACLMLQNKYTEALKDFDNAIKKDANCSEAYFLKATIYQFNAKINDAISFYSKAIKINNNYADAYLMRGLLYATIKNKSDACKDLKRAIQLGSIKAKIHLQDICGSN